MVQPQKPAPKIVAAVGSAAGHPKAAGTPHPAPAKTSGPSGKTMEQAMADAITKALAEGVTDQEEIKKRQLAARDAVKNG